tara:strand:+ start:116 stop:520 length:405 start_codon:yes stop_codon:yes gene_type:complete
MFIAVDPKNYISILHQNRHSIFPIDEHTIVAILNEYRHIDAECVILNNDNRFDVGFWYGLALSYNWQIDIIESETWMDYFGLYPEDKTERIKHWMSIAKLRYPMMKVDENNFEVILSACYLHDKFKAEINASFA